MTLRSSLSIVALCLAAPALGGCGCPRPERINPASGATETSPSRAVEPVRMGDRAAIDEVIDGWHAAAARADEEAYFGAMSEDAVFLGTDATERWDKAAFRAYAHPHFAKGKAWSFEATRRDVIFGPQGRLAWFDEDLATPNLGPARGSGVVVKEDGVWRIAHYNLAITVPNERFDEVKALLDSPPADDDSAQRE